MRSVMNGDVIVHFTFFFSFLGVVWIRALKMVFGVGSLRESRASTPQF